MKDVLAEDGIMKPKTRLNEGGRTKRMRRGRKTGESGDHLEKQKGGEKKFTSGLRGNGDWGGTTGKSWEKEKTRNLGKNMRLLGKKDSKTEPTVN